MEDEELLRAFVGGDRAAFTTLVQRYHGAVVRVAGYYAGPLADDVAQDTWIAVLRSAAGFEGRSSFKTWLFTIAANRARTAGTRERRTVPVDPTDPVAAEKFNEAGMWREAPISFADVLADRDADQALVAKIRACVEQLAEIPRVVVTLRDIEGLSTSDVASVLDLSEANVRVLVHRARAQLRSMLEEAVKEVS